jgi:hypothetical protein
MGTQAGGKTTSLNRGALLVARKEPWHECARRKALRHLNASLNLDALWMPFTANRQFKAAPRLLVSAKDTHY